MNNLGGFDFGGSAKDNADNFYAYNETSGGGGNNKNSGCSGGGCLGALAVFGVIYLIVSLCGGH
ncbi:hypothetical protein [Acetanaerobacterium elongatum]|uniref:Uncharacterized protein n=1 Tax=Acetanaerobacterium elongatum TaxID=258515 RepID=A0A1G9UP87_9FIRM|nr:hypothetical protein [Acetanaerobacterium elongatum]SDM61748.1 hypothetical protein SAMN05192585_10278 [Acetanaerobacterium elongatum]